jgi:hypothetical protein
VDEVDDLVPQRPGGGQDDRDHREEDRGEQRERGQPALPSAPLQPRDQWVEAEREDDRDEDRQQRAERQDRDRDERERGQDDEHRPDRDDDLYALRASIHPRSVPAARMTPNHLSRVIRGHQEAP